MVELERALVSTEFVDASHPAVRNFALDVLAGATGKSAARALFAAVRDRIRYEGVADFSARSSYRASDVLLAQRGFCIGKASLLAAAARAVGIPARLGFADVVNHLATPRLRALIDGEVVGWHGYALLWLDGRWFELSPAFDQQTCSKLKTHVVEFDGESDALLQPFDLENRRHMEYVRDHGVYDDVPFEVVSAELAALHPRVLALARARASTPPATPRSLAMSSVLPIQLGKVNEETHDESRSQHQTANHRSTALADGGFGPEAVVLRSGRRLAGSIGAPDLF
ncbi:MAG TPA: transglutaminase-like domain-containing protein [Polyangiaceae bacterium]|nr:transglutaminase-like domain-containing protein [Polyangiaceae bacterium]